MKAYFLGLYEKAMPPDVSWRERLTAAKEAGYDYVEMCIDATPERIRRINLSKEERLALIETMYDVGIPIRSMSVSALTKYSLGNPDPQLEKWGTEILTGSIELAADLGMRVVMVPGYDVYYEPSTPETAARFQKNLRSAVDLAAKLGVQLGFETMENEFMNTVKKAMRYVTLIDSNYLKVYPDIGNMTNAAVEYGTDVLEDLELGRGNVTSLHLKETKPGVYREVPYGEGHVDFEAAIAKAWEMGVRRYVTEFWYLESSDWKKDLCAARARMGEILDRQEVFTKIP